jgi:hypothetical protein
MAGLEFNAGRLGARSKGVSVAVAVLGVAVFLVDYVLLRGEHVAHAQVYFDRSEPARIAVDRVGERYLVEISTRKRIHGETRGRRIAYRLEDPRGEVIEQGSELRARKTRYFSFMAVESGEYTLHIEDGGMLMKSTHGSARVDVYVNDHRIFGRLSSAIPF